MNTPTTVIIFAAIYDPWISGAERCVKEIVERLSAHRRFVVFTSRRARNLPRREIRGNYEIRRLGVGHPIDKWLFVLLAPLAALGVRATVAHAVMESYAAVALWLYGFLRPETKRMLTLQSGDLDDPRKQRIIPRWLWKKLHTNPDCVTAISRSLADRAVGLGTDPGRVRVIPNGADISAMNRQTDEERVAHRIVTVARLSWEKGLDALLHAVASLRADVPDAHLVIVGDGPLRATLEDHVRSLDLAGAVTFRGALPNPEALAVVRTGAVFALPSRAEGLGIVFVEAQASGVPVIGTRVGGIPDVISDGISGLLVPPDDVRALAHAISRVFADRSLAARLTAGACGRLGRFDWSVIVNAYDALYDSLGLSPRVILAASIYPPDPGGPATIAKMFVASWQSSGRCAAVCIRRARNIVLYAGSLWRQSRRADVVFAHDASATGAVAALVARLLGKKFVVRLGGDLLWERAAATGGTAAGLGPYYASGEWRKGAALYRLLLAQVLRRADAVVFPNTWLPELYAAAGIFDRRKEAIIVNPVPEWPPNDPPAPVKRQLLIIGRLIPLKNVHKTLEACRSAQFATTPFTVTIIGDGPLAEVIADWKKKNAASWLMVERGWMRERLLREMRQSLGTITLSWSEVSPNIVIESLSVGTPALVTRENGNRALLDGYALQIDPDDPAAIQSGIMELVSDSGQRHWRERARAFRWPQTATSMMDQYEKLLTRVCAS